MAPALMMSTVPKSSPASGTGMAPKFQAQASEGKKKMQSSGFRSAMRRIAHLNTSPAASVADTMAPMGHPVLHACPALLGSGLTAPSQSPPVRRHVGEAPFSRGLSPRTKIISEWSPARCCSTVAPVISWFEDASKDSSRQEPRKGGCRRRTEIDGIDNVTCNPSRLKSATKVTRHVWPACDDRLRRSATQRIRNN